MDHCANKRYCAFIGCCHADNETPNRHWATWLQQKLADYQVPELAGQCSNEKISQQLQPVFKMVCDSSQSVQLTPAMLSALNSSAVLVVICSPNAARSEHLAMQIEAFKKQGNANRIVAVVIDGDPNASWHKKAWQRESYSDQECLPLSLQERNSHATILDDLVIADFRVARHHGSKQGWTNDVGYRQYLADNTTMSNKSIDNAVDEYQLVLDRALLKVVAQILQVPLYELIQRDKSYQQLLQRLKSKQLRRWLGSLVVLAFKEAGHSVFSVPKYQEMKTHRNKFFIGNDDLMAQNIVLTPRQIEQQPLEPNVPSQTEIRKQSQFLLQVADEALNKAQYTAQVEHEARNNAEHTVQVARELRSKAEQQMQNEIEGRKNADLLLQTATQAKCKAQWAAQVASDNANSAKSMVQIAIDERIKAQNIRVDVRALAMSATSQECDSSIAVIFNDDHEEQARQLGACEKAQETELVAIALRDKALALALSTVDERDKTVDVERAAIAAWDKAVVAEKSAIARRESAVVAEHTAIEQRGNAVASEQTAIAARDKAMLEKETITESIDHAQQAPITGQYSVFEILKKTLKRQKLKLYNMLAPEFCADENGLLSAHQQVCGLLTTIDVEKYQPSVEHSAGCPLVKEPINAQDDELLHQAYMLLGRVDRLLQTPEHDIKDCQSKLEEADGLLAILYHKYIQVPLHANNFAIAREYLGDFYSSDCYDVDFALTFYTESLDILKMLLAKQPNNDHYQKQRLSLHLKIGNLYLNEKRAEQALSFYTAGLKLSEQALTNSSYYKQQALLYSKLGDSYLLSGDEEQAQAAYFNAMNRQMAVTAAKTQDGDFDAWLNAHYMRILIGLMQTGKISTGYLAGTQGSNDKAMIEKLSHFIESLEGKV